MNPSRYSTLAAAAAALATQLATAPDAEAAAVPVIQNNELVGIDGLDVNGHLYDVTFSPVTGVTPNPQFVGVVQAVTASQVMAIELVTLASIPNPSPFEITGCDAFNPSGECRIFTPFAPHLGSVNVSFVEWILSADTGGNISLAGPSAGFPSQGLGYDYATWTAVPEPTTMTLVGLGLAGVAGARRARRKKALTDGPPAR